MTRVASSALIVLIVLMLEALPADAFVPSRVCHDIRRGESATQAARRMTGNSRNAYQPWFQIMNASSKFVPKSQYDHIYAGWRACVSTPAKPSVFSNTNHGKESEAGNVSEAPRGSSVPEVLAAPAAFASPGGPGRPGAVGNAGDGLLFAAAGVFRRLEGVDFTMLWLCTAVVVPWLGWRTVDGYLARRQTVSIIVGSFVDRFVDEFERPLVRYDAGERPVRARFRHSARLRRFDILLAPGEGRRYPNLSDHKKNVEYDVARVMHVLGDSSFVSGRPYTRAGWIVVPFRFTADPRQSGVTCISSL